MKNNKPRVISLFTGCGGFDLGFVKSGYKVVFANDNQISIEGTYNYNFNHKILIKDICSVEKSNIPQGDIILAGIPCQPFSSAGNRNSTRDSRGNLFQQVLETIKGQVIKPKIVIFENVRGFLSSHDENGLPMVERLRKEMNKFEYNTFYQLINASDYGVPSNRHRVFIVCVNNNIDKEYFFPQASFTESSKIKVGDVLKKSLPEDEKTEVWNLSPSSISIAKHISEGGSWKEVPFELLPERLKRIKKEIKKYRSPNFYRRFSRKEVMGTITAASTPENSGIIHPFELRRYSVREIARFQSFPDDFKFIGDSNSAKYKMIGNAVPPLLAENIAKSMKEQFFLD